MFSFSFNQSIFTTLLISISVYKIRYLAHLTSASLFINMAFVVSHIRCEKKRAVFAGSDRLKKAVKQ